jgi:hypothetical protein
MRSGNKWFTFETIVFGLAIAFCTWMAVQAGIWWWTLSAVDKFGR